MPVNDHGNATKALLAYLLRVDVMQQVSIHDNRCSLSCICQPTRAFQTQPLIESWLTTKKRAGSNKTPFDLTDVQSVYHHASYVITSTVYLVSLTLSHWPCLIELVSRLRQICGKVSIACLRWEKEWDWRLSIMEVRGRRRNSSSQPRSSTLRSGLLSLSRLG